MIKRGEIYWVNLDPAIGSEIRKTRPAVIVSNDINNVHAQTVTVLPLTTATGKVFPFEVPLPADLTGTRGGSKAKANQVRTVDKQRLGKLAGLVPPVLMAKVDAALKLHLDL